MAMEIFSQLDSDVTSDLDFRPSLLFKVIIPLKDNEGKSLAQEIKSIKRDIMGITGGLSSSLVHGQWLDKNITFNDKSWMIYTYCDQSQINALLSMVSRWKLETRQLALCVEVNGSLVSIS